MSAPAETTAATGHRERKKLATWRAIRASALELFAASSFEAVSVEEIAAAAGISKTTYFNYFATKEAVVLDPDPQAPEHWRRLMAERPDDEGLWASVQAVVLGYYETYADRIALHCRLKLESPQLAASARDTGDRFWGELRDWALTRSPEADELQVHVLINAARAGAATVYERWQPDQPFERFLDLATMCFELLGRGFAADPISPPAPRR